MTPEQTVTLTVTVRTTQRDPRKILTEVTRVVGNAFGAAAHVTLDKPANDHQRARYTEVCSKCWEDWPCAGSLALDNPPRRADTD